MGISTQGSTNVSLNTAATFVGASPKNMRNVGNKTYPRYSTGQVTINNLARNISLYQVIVRSNNVAQGTVSVTYPYSESGQDAGTNFYVINSIYAYITIVATSIYPNYFRRWGATTGSATPILTGGTYTGANQPYGTAVSPIVYSYNFNTTDAATYTTVFAIFS